MPRKKPPAMLFTISLLVIFSISPSVSICDANLGNMAMMQEGSSFHNGTHISMPIADVNINITRYEDYAIVNMSATFLVTTSMTQNATLAFVYPSFASSGSEAASMLTKGTMCILANGTMMNYSILFWDDFLESGFTSDFLSTAYYIQPYADFAVFEIELIANTTLVFNVISNSAYILAGMNLFQYYYIVGSARTFEGDTYERVHMRLREIASFIDTAFLPNETLSIIPNHELTDAIWNFTISEFAHDFVMFQGQIRVSPETFIGPDLILTFGAVVVILVLLATRIRYPRNN